MEENSKKKLNSKSNDRVEGKNLHKLKYASPEMWMHKFMRKSQTELQTSN